MSATDIQIEQCATCTADAVAGCVGCDRGCCTDCLTQVGVGEWLCPECIGGAR